MDVYIHNFQISVEQKFTSTLHDMCMYSNTSKFKWCLFIISSKSEEFLMGIPAPWPCPRPIVIS